MMEIKRGGQWFREVGQGRYLFTSKAVEEAGLIKEIFGFDCIIEKVRGEFRIFGRCHIEEEQRNVNRKESH